MQLIEIVQLALIGFAALILILFFVSYFGYKRKKKNRGNLSSNNNLIKSDHGSIEAITLEEKENIKELPAQGDKSQKYKVFNPNLSDTKGKSIMIKKKHFPRTLFIKK